MHVTVTIVLALATLGGKTKNRDDPISVLQPEVPRQVQYWLLLVAVAGVIMLAFAN
jgi:hypothetical protein